MDAGGTYYLPQDPDFWEAVKNQYKDRTAMLLAKEEQLRQKVAEMELMLAKQEKRGNLYRCNSPTGVPKVFPQIPDHIQKVPKIIRESSPVPSLLTSTQTSCISSPCPPCIISSSPPCIISTKPPCITSECSPCITSSCPPSMSAKKEYYASNFFQKVMENAKSILAMRCTVVNPRNAVDEKPTKETDDRCSCTVSSDRQKSSNKVDFSDSVHADTSCAVCDDVTRTDVSTMSDNGSQDVPTSFSCSVTSCKNLPTTLSADVMTDTKKDNSSLINSCICAMSNVAGAPTRQNVADSTCQCCNPECGKDSDKIQITDLNLGTGNQIPCQCKHSSSAKTKKTGSGDNSKKKCTNETCPVMASRSAPAVTGTGTNAGDTPKTGKAGSGQECVAPDTCPVIRSSAASKDSKAPENNSKGSSKDSSCRCDLKTINDLAAKEKMIKDQIRDLQQREKSYETLMGNFRNMTSKTTCTCCTIVQEPSSDFDRIGKELQVENKLLRSELDEMKMELKHCLEKIQGPMKNKLEAEKYKCMSLETELNKAAQNMVINHDTHTKEMNALKLQLCTACNNISELNAMNRRLKGEMDSLDCMCAKLEEDLMRQKINEAETLKMLSRRRPDFQEMGTGGTIQDSSRCDCTLDVIARKLSSTLKESAPCKECAKLPPELTSAARCIKDLTDMVQKRKKEVEAVMGTTRDSASQSPRTDDAGIQCTGCLDADTNATKTLLDAPSTFPEKDSSRCTALEIPSEAGSTYYSAEDGGNLDLACKNTCDDTEPCTVIGKPCTEGDIRKGKGTTQEEAATLRVVTPVAQKPLERQGDDDVCLEPCGDTAPCSQGKPCFEIETDLSQVKSDTEELVTAEGDELPGSASSQEAAPAGEAEIPGEDGAEESPPKDRSAVETCKTCIEEGICKAFLQQTSAVDKPSEEISDIPLDGEGEPAETPDAGVAPESGTPSAVAGMDAEQDDISPDTPDAGASDAPAMDSPMGEEPSDVAAPDEEISGTPAEPDGAADFVAPDVSGGEMDADDAPDVADATPDSAPEMQGDEGGAAMMGDPSAADGGGFTMAGGAGGLPFKEERTGNFPFDVDTQAELLHEPPADLQVTTTITGSGTLEVITEGAGGVIETTLTYKDDGTLEVFTQLTEEHKGTAGAMDAPEAAMAAQDSIMSGGDTDLSGGLETVSEHTKSITISSTSEADQTSVMAGTGRIDDTLETEGTTNVIDKDLSDMTEVPTEVPAEVPAAPAAPAEADVPAAPAEADVPAAPAEADVPVAPAEADVPAAPAEADVPAAPAEADIPAAPAEADVPDVPTEADVPSAPTEVDVPAAPAEAGEEPIEEESHDALPGKEEGEEYHDALGEKDDSGLVPGKDICVCPDQGTAPPKEEVPEAEAPEEAPEAEAAEEGAEESAEEGESGGKKKHVCVCDSKGAIKKPSEEPDEEGEAEEGEATEGEGEPTEGEGEPTEEGDEGEKAIADGEMITEPTEEGDAAVEGEAMLVDAEEGGEPAEGEESAEEAADTGEDAEPAEGEETAEEAPEKGEEDAEPAEGEETAEEAPEKGEEDAEPAEGEEAAEEAPEKGEELAMKGRKRDYSCQSTAAVDESCQCCECKNVGVSTTQDTETVTESMVQSGEKFPVEVIPEEAEPESDTDVAEAGSIEDGKIQGSADEVTTLNEDASSNPDVKTDGEASDYVTAQDKSECTAPCRTSRAVITQASTDKPEGVEGHCSEFITEECLEPCQDVGVQCDCAGDGVERDDHSEGRISGPDMTSGSDTENDIPEKTSKDSKKLESEVPDSVSKLSAATSKTPSIGSTESKKPRKKRSSRLENIRCECPGICQCVVCAPDIIAKRKALTGSPLPPTGQAGKLCCCLPRPRAQTDTYQNRSCPPQQVTQAFVQSQMPTYNAHQSGCECTECLCNCTPGPPGRLRTSINDVFDRQPNARMDQRQPPANTCNPNGHPRNCECIDCLCMPTIKQLASLREIPVIKDEKQVFQVKCVCAKKTSKIPIPTNSPSGPPKAKTTITCTCEKCSCSPCLSKQAAGAAAGSDLAKLCDCKECQCTVCFNKPPKKDDKSSKTCCCKGDCKCDSCPAGGGKKGGAGHPEGCDCDECLCPKSPNMKGSQPPEADAAAAAGGTKKPTPPGCDCADCKCPGMTGDALPVPPGCDCAVCACPGREAAVGKKMAECDCPECECSPCADPKKRPGEPVISPCDCPDCKCAPCADPAKSGAKGDGKHPTTCDCPECKCEGQRCLQTDAGVGSSENKATHTPDCICDECLCDKEQHESGCTCPECKCTDCIFKTGQQTSSDACKCGDCKCEDCPKKNKDGGDGAGGCTCTVCDCTDCIFKKGQGGDECKCGDCKCTDCPKKDKGGAASEDAHDGDCPCSDCFFKRSNEAAEICKCGTCLCVDCPKKKPDGGDSAKKGGGGGGGGACSCIVCECDECVDPSKKKSGGQKKDGDKAGGCSCGDCKCVDCIHKKGAGGQKGAAAATGKGCTCSTCLCVDCTGKKADASKSGTKFTDPPPFQVPVKESCKCDKCDCVICKSKGGGGGGGGGGKGECKCDKCACSPCPGGGKSGGAGGSPPPFQEPVRLPCTCPNCDCVSCSKGGGKSGGGSKAALGDQCPCKKCECSPCRKKGGAGGKGDPPPFEVPIRAPCTCKKCECVSCNKSPTKSAAASATVLQCDCATCTCDNCTKLVSGKSSKANAGDGCTCPSSVSKMGNNELVAKIKKDTKENCECREQIKELKRALDKIKCACTEAEVKASKNKPFVKQASAFGQTMSGLKFALTNLQEKCKAKDKMIEVMTDELKLRTDSNTVHKVMHTNRCTDALDYDKADDVQTLDSVSTNVLFAGCGEEKELGHTKVRPKSSECSAPCKGKSKKKLKSHKGKDGGNVDLAGFEVVDIRRITQDSVIIKWKPPKSSLVTGYDIFINGVNKSKVMSGGRTSAMIHSLDLSATIQITIYAVTKCGRCEPPAIAIYEISC